MVSLDPVAGCPWSTLELEGKTSYQHYAGLQQQQKLDLCPASACTTHVLYSNAYSNITFDLRHYADWFYGKTTGAAVRARGSKFKT